MRTTRVREESSLREALGAGTRLALARSTPNSQFPTLLFGSWKLTRYGRAGSMSTAMPLHLP
jgi:hypothetical protein